MDKYLYVNDEKIPYIKGENLLSLIKRLNLKNEGTAIVLNGKIIFKEEYESIILKENDNIEIISVVGGG